MNNNNPIAKLPAQTDAYLYMDNVEQQQTGGISGMKNKLLFLLPLLFLTGCNLIKPGQPSGLSQDKSQNAIPALHSGITSTPTEAIDTAETREMAASDAPVMLASIEPSLDSEALAQPEDIWNRLRDGFRMRDYEHKRVQSELKWFAKNQNYLDRVAERAEPFLHLILEEVERRNMPSEIALLPVVESAFQPFAYSHGRAAGIWQFIPGTGRIYGLNRTGGTTAAVTW